MQSFQFIGSFWISYCTQYRYAKALPCPIRGALVGPTCCLGGSSNERTRSAGASKASRCLSEMLPLLDLYMGCALLCLFPRSLDPHLAFGDVWVLQQRKSESIRVLQLQWASLLQDTKCVCYLYFDSDFLYFCIGFWLNMAVKSSRFFGF